MSMVMILWVIWLLPEAVDAMYTCSGSLTRGCESHEGQTDEMLANRRLDVVAVGTSLYQTPGADMIQRGALYFGAGSGTDPMRSKAIRRKTNFRMIVLAVNQVPDG